MRRTGSGQLFIAPWQLDGVVGGDLKAGENTVNENYRKCSCVFLNYQLPLDTVH